jgi:transcriptional regulator with XRE-family HTH domain
MGVPVRGSRSEWTCQGHLHAGQAGRPLPSVAIVSDNELGNYLRTLRGLVSPEQVGLSHTGRRRVPGLRRAEVSELVGLSTEYYIRLEQGRAERPSETVLRAISRALRLGPAEEAHLFDLARHPRAITPSKPDRLRHGLDHVVHGITDYPALLMNRGMDVLSWNPLAAALFTDFGALPASERNMARHIFLDPAARALHGDWEVAAMDSVGILRLATKRPPLEETLVSLLAELSSRSADFVRLWDTHYVHEKTHGIRVFRHPVVGELTVRYETFLVAGQQHHMLVVYTVEPDSAAADRLWQLKLIASSAGSRGPAGRSPARLEHAGV